ncbi:phosphate ABC transporter ATP-binding protein, partial [Desulfovibrio piger]
MTPLVRIRDLCLHLNGRAILHHVDLELPRHGISVLLGRSGSGKTSFLRCLNRLHDCTRDSRMQGKIELLLDGTMQDISRLQGEEALSRLRRQVGMVFQTPNVLPASIGQNLLLPLQLAAGLDMDEARSRARRSLEDVGLWPEVHDRLGEPAASLSGGQQQRLCLARTLALEPQILLLDEPTASLDPASTRRIEDLLRHLSERYAI